MIESIGLFQLENLFLARSPFIFLDLRENESELPQPVAGYLKAAVRVGPAEVRAHLKDTEKSRAILLICEDAKSSSKAGADLIAAGFSNIYVVEGGVGGLLSEL